MASALPVVDQMANVLGGEGTDDESEKLTQNNNNNNYNNYNNNLLLNSNNPAENIENFKELPRSKVCSSVKDFYNGANVLITGGTGFLGKILVEKLLRSCPGVENIYLLVRQKKGKDVHTRLDEIFEDPLFDILKQELPKFRHKIVVVPGDVSFAGLGLNICDRQMLIEKTNVVIHAAATVRFDEKIKLALSINVHGVKSILDLCKSMTKLKVLVHVSTAYSNCHRKDIKEIFYKYPINAEEVEKLVAKSDDEVLDKIMPSILGEWPNTYTFTKALAEDYIRQNSKGLPMGIFRPAIVTSTYQEPVIGWVDNLYGPTGVVAGAGTGVLRSMHCNPKMNANIVPVDYCVNALLAATWDIANNHKDRSEENMLIYNYVSSVEKPLSWFDFLTLNVNYGFKYPFASAVWYYCFTLNKHATMHKIYAVLLHYVPAILVDGLALCVGQKPRLLKVYGKIHKFAEVISFFCTHDWDFSNNNVQRLWDKLDAKEKQVFPFSIKNIDWVQYFSFYMKGMRTYLFKEQCDIKTARRRWNRLYILHFLLKTTLTVSFSWMFWRIMLRAFFST